MSWTKTDEDIREEIDSRMGDSGRDYYGNMYINRSPDYPSRKSESIGDTYYVSQSLCHSKTNTYRSDARTSTPTMISKFSTPAANILANQPTSTPKKQKIGYIQRDHTHYGIEIYFYNKPNKSTREELVDNGWFWHRQKKCWFKRYSIAAQKFADNIIER